MTLTYASRPALPLPEKKTIKDIKPGTAFAWSDSPDFKTARYAHIKLEDRPGRKGVWTLNMSESSFYEAAFGDSPVYFFEVSLTGEVKDKLL